MYSCPSMHGNSRAECIRVESDVQLTPLAAAALSALATLAPTTAAAPIITFTVVHVTVFSAAPITTFAVVHVTVFGLTVFGFTVIFVTGAGLAVIHVDIVVWTSRPGPLCTLLVVNLVIAVVHAKSAKAHILVGLAILVDFISTSDSHRRRHPPRSVTSGVAGFRRVICVVFFRVSLRWWPWWWLLVARRSCS